MAHNQYNQRMPPQPSQGQFQGEPQLNGWSNGGGQYYDNGYQQKGLSYGDWDYSQPAGDQYEQYAPPNPYGEDKHWRAQQGYSQPDGQSYDQQQSHQQYQYDPRYRSQGQPLNGQTERRPDQRERPGRDKQRPPHMDLKAKSKCRWIIICFYPY